MLHPCVFCKIYELLKLLVLDCEMYGKKTVKRTNSSLENIMCWRVPLSLGKYVRCRLCCSKMSSLWFKICWSHVSGTWSHGPIRRGWTSATWPMIFRSSLVNCQTLIIYKGSPFNINKWFLHERFNFLKRVLSYQKLTPPSAFPIVFKQFC